MPVLDLPAIAGTLANLGVSILSYAGIALILYNIGGILIRTVSWTFDKLLINFIGYFYKYFEIIINGTLLTDPVVKSMMNRVYLLVGVFVAFRLGALIINYIINPSEVMDDKVGVNALIKRIILGLALIIFLPTIFSYAFQIQEAILNDQVIERVIMSETEMNDVKKYKSKHGMGKIIGMTVFQGFFTISPSGQSVGKAKTAYEKATDINQSYDLSAIDNLSMGGVFNSGIIAQSGDDYVFDYFPIFSTVVLAFILYLVIQYCLDAVVRSFKLSILQVIAPIAIVEYMINNDRNEVFKSWKKAVISTFAMLFMRIISIWFVAYVTMLMQPGSGISSNSLLQTGDNLLKAIIVLGLLAFMMDFPKMMSDIFGLDLDQSGSVKAVMGKAMAGATAGLAIGGAAVGAMSKPMKSVTRAGLSGMGNVGKSLASSIGSSKTFGRIKSRAGKIGGALSKPFKSLGTSIKNSSAGQGITNRKARMTNWAKNGPGGGARFARTLGKTAQSIGKAGAAGVKSAANVAKTEHLGTAMKAGAMALGGAVLASNSVTKSAAGGYQQASGAVDNKVSAQNAKEKEASDTARANRNETIQANIQANLEDIAKQLNSQAQNFQLQATMDIAANIKANNPGITSAALASQVVDMQVNANPVINSQAANLSAAINAAASGGEIATVDQAVNVVATSLQSSGMSDQQITTVVNEVRGTYDSGGKIGSGDAQKLVEKPYRDELTPTAEQASKLV